MAEVNNYNPPNQTAVATLLNLVQGVNALNVTVEDSSDTSTTDLTAITNAINSVTTAIAAAFPPVLTSSKTYDPPSIADKASATTTVTVTGAALGKIASASFSIDLAGLILTAYVSSANTVTCVFGNLTGGAVDLASGTLFAQVQH